MGISLKQTMGRAALYAKLTVTNVPGVSQAMFDFMLAGTGIACIREMHEAEPIHIGDFLIRMAGGKAGQGPGGGDIAVIERRTQTHQKPKRPDLYKVILHNDDYTPMGFVVEVLQKFFQKNKEDAKRIMLQVHNEGLAKLGAYTLEVAETKAYDVMDYSKGHGHPFLATYEKA